MARTLEQILENEKPEVVAEATAKAEATLLNIHLGEIRAPLAWFPRLLHADKAARACFELSVHGIHWDELDEDISVQGLLAGQGDQTHPKKDHAA